jgi:RNA polymerase sigma-70 factor (ECF subfamily)
MWCSILAFAGEPEVASDAVAEAFAQVLRRGDAVRDPERWVWRTAFLIARSALKDRNRPRAGPPQETYEMKEPGTDLMRALKRLPETQRAAVVLHHAGGYPMKEVAEILGSTTAAVKVHCLRARRRLRHLLDDQLEEE